MVVPVPPLRGDMVVVAYRTGKVFRRCVEFSPASPEWLVGIEDAQRSDDITVENMVRAAASQIQAPPFFGRGYADAGRIKVLAYSTSRRRLAEAACIMNTRISSLCMTCPSLHSESISRVTSPRHESC